MAIQACQGRCARDLDQYMWKKTVSVNRSKTLHNNPDVHISLGFVSVLVWISNSILYNNAWDGIQKSYLIPSRVWTSNLHALRAQVVADAFVSQMTSEASSLRAAKDAVETALSAGEALGDVRVQLDAANEKYRQASVQVRKHTAPPKPKASAKAKQAAAATSTAWKSCIFCWIKCGLLQKLV